MSKFILGIACAYAILQFISLAESQQLQVTKKSLFTKKTGQLHSLANNTQTGEQLFVWPKRSVFSLVNPEPAQILGRIYNSKGTPVTNTLVLAQSKDKPVNKASVAYNPKLNEYLLIYDNSVDYPCHLFSLRLDSKGKPIGSSNKITNDPEIQDHCNNAPQVLYNPKTEAYTVFWEVHIFAGCSIGRCTYQAGISLTEKGIPKGHSIPIATGFNSPSEVDWYCGYWNYLSSINKFIGMCSGGGLGFDGVIQGIYFLGTLDPELRNITQSNFAKVNTTPIQVTSPCQCDSSNQLSLTSEQSAALYFADSSGIVRGLTINLNGKVTGSPFTAFNAPKTTTKFYLLNASFTNTPKGPRGILIGTERQNEAEPGRVDGPSFVWAQIVDEAGRPLGKPVQILTVPQDAWVYSLVGAMIGNAADADFLFSAYIS
jgi:hypothetical protein